jgi:Na+/proline symporter
MKLSIIIIISVAYIALLFFLAYYAESREKKGRSIVNNPLAYALSLSIYCTAWTFYGSVGRAASTGIGFLPIYLGPAILAPVWWIVLKKMVLISKSLRITSIADFISSRYGKSATLGLIATLIAVLGVIPYISIQLKAIVNSFHLLRGVEVAPNTEIPFFQDSALFIAIALAVFTILFGTRHLDPNERHPGLVAAIAFESVLKLVAFISIGLFVCFGLYGGFENLFNQAAQSEKVAHLFQASFNTVNAWEWFWLIILSMSAVLFPAPAISCSGGGKYRYQPYPQGLLDVPPLPDGDQHLCHPHSAGRPAVFSGRTDRARQLCAQPAAGLWQRLSGTFCCPGWFFCRHQHGRRSRDCPEYYDRQQPGPALFTALQQYTGRPGL